MNDQAGHRRLAIQPRAVPSSRHLTSEQDAALCEGLFSWQMARVDARRFPMPPETIGESKYRCHLARGLHH
jgi:hypothetical protein